MKAFLFLLLFNIILSPELTATPTKLVVRALSKDAKFIGSSMGGARIIVRNALTGEILAEGLTRGGTGDTELLMKTPHQRFEQLAGNDAASFETTLDIENPLKIKIEVYAPAFPDQNQASASKEIWLIPGKNIDGDGIILEIPGFMVDLRHPFSKSEVKAGQPVEIKVNVTMMCGCPITRGGLWDGTKYEVVAIFKKGEEEVAKVPLSISEQTNLFTASHTFKSAGTYQVMVYAFDPQTSNSGVDQAYFAVTE